MVVVIDRDNELHDAIRYGKPSEMILDLMNINPRLVQEKNERGQTPLHLIWEHIMYYGILHCPSPDYSTVIARCLDICPSLAKEPNDIGDTPLHMALLSVQVQDHHDPEMIRRLIDTDPSVLEKGNDEGNYPIHIACCCNPCLTMVEHMLQHADHLVHVRNGIGGTPLHVACGNGSDRIVELLLQRPDIDVNARDVDHDTPLHIIVQVLLQSSVIDAVPTIRALFDNDKKQRQLRIMTMLLDHPNIVIHQKNSSGKTPIDVIRDDLHRKHENNEWLPVIALKMKSLWEGHVEKRRHWWIYSYVTKHLTSMIHETTAIDMNLH